MKIGVIFTGYNCAEYINDALDSWIDAKKESIDGNEFIIAAVSCPFSGFPFTKPDKTHEILNQLYALKFIDYKFLGKTECSETNARSWALKRLAEGGADVVIQVDSDELYTLDDILNIFRFVSENPYVVWFSGCLKNYVFDETTYLAEPFRPARIHRIKFHDYKAFSFYDDNNISYEKPGYPGSQDIIFSHLAIPESVAWVDHLTWLNNDRSRLKIEYQKSRGWVCSFDWDYENNKLIFNKSFYSERSLSVPKILTTDGTIAQI